MTTIAHRLAAIRHALDMTQAEMANLAGISLRTYSRNERSIRNVSTGLLICLIERGFNANWLLTGIGEMRLGDAGEKPQALTENVLREVGASQKKPSRLRRCADEAGASMTGTQELLERALRAMRKLTRHLMNNEGQA